MIGGGYSKFMCYICHENDALPLYSDGGSQLVRLLCSVCLLDIAWHRLDVGLPFNRQWPP